MKKINIPSLILNTLFYVGIIGLVLYVMAGVRYFAMPLTSMEPQVKKNSLVVLRYSSKGNAKLNDIVLVEVKPKQINLFKVSALDNDKIVVVNNEGIVNISQKQIMGRKLFVIPVVGAIILFLKTKWGIIIAGAIILLYIGYKKLLK